MQIRRATESDIPALVEFRARLCDSYLTSIRVADHPDFPDRVAERLRRLLASDTHCFLIATDDAGEPVGMVSAAVELTLPGPTWPGISATISDMWLEPAARGRGTARLLMDGICAWVRAQGAQKVKLHSTPAAVGVYERLGFHIAEVRPGDGDFPVMWQDFER